MNGRRLSAWNWSVEVAKPQQYYVNNVNSYVKISRLFVAISNKCHKMRL
jgi:hypothetical protein